jgi:hypothetical protein
MNCNSNRPRQLISKYLYKNLKLQKPVHSAEAGAEVSPGAEAAGAADVAAAARVEALRIRFTVRALKNHTPTIDKSNDLQKPVQKYLQQPVQESV